MDKGLSIFLPALGAGLVASAAPLVTIHIDKAPL